MATAVPVGAPVAPITLGEDPAATTDRILATTVEVDDALLARLRGVCAEVSTDDAERAEAGRDWWPLAMTWALSGQVGHRPAVVARPQTDEEVAAVLAVCHEHSVPVTAAAGRSGVCGGSVPVHGGVLLDLCGLSGIRSVDPMSMVLDVQAGTFGDRLEDSLRAEHQVTLGHWPQSIALSTVGGWLACRSAGQLSNRYGKIEDMAIGLDVALADGRVIHTGGAPRAAVGPDLNQVFIGSEGTLGVILGARLRLHELPVAEQRAAFGFESFAGANDACRRILQRGARPAVLRVYDAIEAQRSYQTGERHLLLVLDEGDPALVAATMSVVADVCGEAEVLDESLVGRWMEHRNDVAALESLISKDFVVDTMEVAGRWADLDAIYTSTIEAIGAVESTMAVSAHQSHAYPDGACLYFTFAGRPAPDGKDEFYRAAWDAGTRAVLAGGGSLSHHHGVGLNRSRFMATALGDAFGTLVDLKAALDPKGILNPGKLGLPSPFGEVSWPA
ncbi:MAG TPA: FAD-binding oxidoreductase [Acidimicrobiales bacterium]